MHEKSLHVLTMGNELLRQKAQKIKIFDEELINLTKQMFEILKTDKGVGVAGPQLGIMKRIFVIHVEGDAERVFINPSILETSIKTIKLEEGCLSIPGIYSQVVRPETIKIQAWNEKGKPFTLEASGIVARVIMHEYDHLEGVLFLDHIPESKRKKLIEKYEKASQQEIVQKG